MKSFSGAEFSNNLNQTGNINLLLWWKHQSVHKQLAFLFMLYFQEYIGISLKQISRYEKWELLKPITRYLPEICWAHLNYYSVVSSTRFSFNGSARMVTLGRKNLRWNWLFHAWSIQLEQINCDMTLSIVSHFKTFKAELNLFKYRLVPKVKLLTELVSWKFGGNRPFLIDRYQILSPIQQSFMQQCTGVTFQSSSAQCL